MRLIEAAIAEFAERGFDAASYNKIIEHSGLSKGTVYYYFDNKDSLLTTVLNEVCQRFEEAVGDLGFPDTKEEYWTTSREYHRRAMRFFFENPQLLRVLFWLSRDDFQLDERLEAAHEQTADPIRKLISRGQEIGAVRNDLPVHTIQRLLHAIGKVISTDTIGQRIEEINAPPRDEEVRLWIETFMNIMEDLSQRILTPEEARHA
jgi:AcrR family transcriptional regulator